MELELKHIVGYLPYDLKVLRPDGKTILNVAGLLGTLVQHREKDTITYSSLRGCRPFLRPMSDLCKPLEDGSIPMEVILKMLGYDNVERYEDDGLVTYGWNTHICDDWQGYVINWHKRFKWFVSYYDDYDPENEDLNLTGDTEAGNIEVVEYLYAHHFDIHNLIEHNLAIDLNTI
jgi:hypothetical protein